MRRVVSEQIKALNELGEIVARHSSTSTETRATATGGGSTQRPTPPSYGGGSAVLDTPRPSAPRSAASESYGYTPEPRRPTVEPPRPAEGRERGWIADLLRRVSEDEPAPTERAPEPPAPTPVARAPEPPRSAEPQRNPGHTIESLNSLSVDIARAIDNEAFVDLWNRYRRGETHVFTRRLYTLQGQQTFDEIRRRYQRDTDFRSAVDRYIDHFRSLYDDAVRKDPEGALAQGYLNSDTGKVYTMLAHASGKLG